MTRSEFINLWCDTVAAGRRLHHPDIRLSEEAFSRMYDQKTAARHWRKWRHNFRLLTVAQGRALITLHPQTSDTATEEARKVQP
jgi:hypothetical protein